VRGALSRPDRRWWQGRQDGIVALPLPAGSQVGLARLGVDLVDWTSPPPDPADERLASTLLLVDCLAPGIESLMDEVFDRFGRPHAPPSAPAPATTTCARAPVIFTHQGLHDHAALMIGLPRRLALGVRHGWSRVAGPFVVSALARAT
jgi:hypothetical protein